MDFNRQLSYNSAYIRSNVRYVLAKKKTEVSRKRDQLIHPFRSFL